MQGNADTLTFSLEKISTPEALHSLRERVVGALDAGTTQIAIDIDDVGILDSKVISTLIAILRDARERGATVELRASRKSILDTLRITALDKVFTVMEPSASRVAVAVPAARKPAGRGRLVASVAAGALAAASLLGARTAPVTPSASKPPAGVPTVPVRERP